MPSSAATLPNAAALATLRAWYAGLSMRDAVARYMPDELAAGRSARGVIGQIRRALIARAHDAQRPDLVASFRHPAQARVAHAQTVAHAIEALRRSVAPAPQLSDGVEQWLPRRTANRLLAAQLTTLSDLAVRLPTRRRWWEAVPGLGAAGARRIEAFFADHPALAVRAAAVTAQPRADAILPWESLQIPTHLNGEQGTFRAPAHTCTINAHNDYEAVQSWLSLHEAPVTQRTYRKEAERLILWAIIERGKALSSLLTDDVIAYRAFLHRPSPRHRWVGPVRPRHAADWRPFVGPLSPRSISHTLTILGSLFRWLIAQRYLLANPFAGIKVRGVEKPKLDHTRGFTEGEWRLVRVLADGLEPSVNWTPIAATRLRFLLDLAFGTGLRVSELANATLGDIRDDAGGVHWLHVHGKGMKPGRVSMPAFVWSALETSLLARGLPASRALWHPKTPLLASFTDSDGGTLSPGRIWAILKRFFAMAADSIERDHPPLAQKLRVASPHWLRHTHATYLLRQGAELITVRDNLRHASIATTSVYLDGNDDVRAAQTDQSFRSWSQ